MSIPVTSPPLDLITTGLLDFFAQSGRTGYDGAYTGDPVRPAYPYWILYSLAGGSADPMPDLDMDLTTVTAVWQVTAVSNLRNQAQRTRQTLRDLLLARTADRADRLYANTAGWTYPLPMPTGWTCIQRTPDPALPGVDRAGEVPAAVFSAPFRFALTIAPA